MRKILDKSNMTPEDWQKYREQQVGIGGSDVATILGLNPYKTAFTLWLEKTGQIKPPVIDNEYIEWGNLLEPVIRNKFRDETGFEVFENHWVMQHEEYDFMVANIDGEVIDPAYGGEHGVLEIKTAGERMRADWADGPPNHYMLQVQHYLAVLGYNYAYIAVLIGGNHFKYFKIERDDYVIDRIITAERDFMEMVEKRISPEISGHSADSAYIADAFPNDNGEEGELPKPLSDMAFKYLQLQREIKELQAAADEIKNHIKLEAKDYRILKSDIVRVSMPTINKVSFDSKRFASDHPELYEQYKTKESSYRSFTVSLNKEL